MSFFSRIGDFASTAYDATKSFFQSDTAKTIASGAKDVLEVMKEGSQQADLKNFQAQGLVPTRTDFSSAISFSTSSIILPYLFIFF